MAPPDDRKRARPSSGGRPAAGKRPAAAKKHGTRSGPPKSPSGPRQAGRSGPPKSRSGSSRGRPGAPKGRSGPARSRSGPPKGRSAPPKGRRPPPRATRRPSDDEPEEVYRKDWGSLARKGAGRIKPREGVGDSASAEWRRAVQEARDTGAGTDFEPDEWIVVDDAVRREASQAVDRGRRPARREPGPTPLAEHHGELAKALNGQQAARADQALKDAARAFERERFQDARRMLAPWAERAPSVPPLRELLGLTYYRLGRWKQAAKELEAFRTLTDTAEQHPVLADCYRALGRFDRVDDLWDELRQASPSAELVTEGRIVAAGARADQGDLREAIDLLGKGWQLPKRPKPHHLRRAYALADLHERAGNVPRARDLFGRIQRADAGFADVGDRLRALR